MPGGTGSPQWKQDFWLGTFKRLISGMIEFRVSGLRFEIQGLGFRENHSSSRFDHGIGIPHAASPEPSFP